MRRGRYLFLAVAAIACARDRDQPTKQPAPIAVTAPRSAIEPTPVGISVLVRADGHWIGTTDGRRWCVPRAGGSYDREAFERRLALLELELPATKRIEIAAADDVVYQDLISTMDSAIARGFDDLSVLAPDDLSTGRDRGCPAAASE